MKNLMILMGVGLLLGAGYIGFLAYTSRKNISDDSEFGAYLNKPLVFKDTANLYWYGDENQTRFKHYSLQYQDNRSISESDLKSVKQYLPGDTIVFSEAWSYYSLFVGTTPYLIGKTKLNSGETVEFEYYASFTHQPALWETIDEFICRRERERRRE